MFLVDRDPNPHACWIYVTCEWFDSKLVSAVDCSLVKYTWRVRRARYRPRERRFCDELVFRLVDANVRRVRRRIASFVDFDAEYLPFGGDDADPSLLLPGAKHIVH